MIIQPKIRGFICTTAHPIGCFQSVKEQVDYVKAQGQFEGPKNVLIIGSSTGYGLASRIVAAYGSQAKTIGVFFERAAEGKRTASPGWYNSAAFEQLATSDGLYAKSINGDAFSKEIKQRAIDLIRQDLQQVDLIIYSVAAPKRTDPITGQSFSSALKPIGKPFTGKTVDAFAGEVKEVTIEPATETEIAGTVAVMGGEDWEMWIDLLAHENLLAPGVKTVAYSYLGPELTYAVYKDGTIGRAKVHLKKTADKLTERLKKLGGEAVVAVDKAVVTQASAAIPVVPLYIALLFKLMKENGTHEGCIEQMYRLFTTFLYASKSLPRDAEGYIRMDNFEMDAALQQQIAEYWPNVTTENLLTMTDVEGYRDEFYRLFGFNFATIDYNKEVDPVKPIPSLEVLV